MLSWWVNGTQRHRRYWKLVHQRRIWETNWHKAMNINIWLLTERCTFEQKSSNKDVWKKHTRFGSRTCINKEDNGQQLSSWWWCTGNYLEVHWLSMLQEQEMFLYQMWKSTLHLDHYWHHSTIYIITGVCFLCETNREIVSLVSSFKVSLSLYKCIYSKQLPLLNDQCNCVALT